MGPLTLQTPSADHVQFDQICAELDEFEPLPAVSSRLPELDDDGEETPGLEDRILAALVTPVY
ncbi:MAG: hypothetical protein JO244_13745 [Solirubrobacterales bacterium]|nr:hypothetical protein [Solirubrobacterales bacterium]